MPKYILKFASSDKWRTGKNCNLCETTDALYNKIMHLNFSNDQQNDIDILENGLIDGYELLKRYEKNGDAIGSKANILFLKSLSSNNEYFMQRVYNQIYPEKNVTVDNIGVSETPVLVHSRWCCKCGCRKPDIFDTSRNEVLNEIDYIDFSAILKDNKVTITWENIQTENYSKIKLVKYDNYINDRFEILSENIYDPNKSIKNNFIDSKLVAGHVYYYQILLCDESDYVVKRSKIIDIYIEIVDFTPPAEIDDLACEQNRELIKKDDKYEVHDYLKLSWTDPIDDDFYKTILRLGSKFVPGLYDIDYCETIEGKTVDINTNTYIDEFKKGISYYDFSKYSSNGYLSDCTLNDMNLGNMVFLSNYSKNLTPWINVNFNNCNFAGSSIGNYFSHVNFFCCDMRMLNMKYEIAYDSNGLAYKETNIQKGVSFFNSCDNLKYKYGQLLSSGSTQAYITLKNKPNKNINSNNYKAFVNTSYYNGDNMIYNDCNLSGAVFGHHNTSNFINSNMSYCYFEINIDNCKFDNCDLTNTFFSGMNTVTFVNCDLTNAKFSDAIINCTFINCKLNKIQSYYPIVMINCEYDNCEIKNGRISFGVISCTFNKCDLSNSILKYNAMRELDKVDQFSDITLMNNSNFIDCDLRNLELSLKNTPGIQGYFNNNTFTNCLINGSSLDDDNVLLDISTNTNNVLSNFNRNDKLITNEIIEAAKIVDFDKEYYFKLYPCDRSQLQKSQYHEKYIEYNNYNMNCKPILFKPKSFTSDCKNVKIRYNDNKFFITWDDPPETKWCGTIVMIKESDELILNKDDGIVVEKIYAIKNKYSSNELIIDNIEEGEKYVVGIFPVINDNIVDINLNNQYKVVSGKMNEDIYITFDNDDYKNKFYNLEYFYAKNDFSSQRFDFDNNKWIPHYLGDERKNRVLCSDNVNNNEVGLALIELNNVNNGATITFDYKFSSNSEEDSFRFYINDVQYLKNISRISAGWNNFTCNIKANKYVKIRFEYNKKNKSESGFLLLDKIIIKFNHR